MPPELASSLKSVSAGKCNRAQKTSKSETVVSSVIIIRTVFGKYLLSVDLERRQSRKGAFQSEWLQMRCAVYSIAHTYTQFMRIGNRKEAGKRT